MIVVHDSHCPQGSRVGPLMQLSERVSGSGNRYFSGWLGKARLVGFLADEPDGDGNPLWNVYAAEPGKRP